MKKIIIGFLTFFAAFAFTFSTVEAEKCSGSGCISSADFIVPIETFSPNGRSELASGSSANETVDNILATIIGNLIVAFGVLSLLVMTIGGGYMIFHAGEESLLSRGKSIFIYGLVSLAIALSAGIIVQIVTYLLYTVD